jgi:hypothetical protein
MASQSAHGGLGATMQRPASEPHPGRGGNDETSGLRLRSFPAPTEANGRFGSNAASGDGVIERRKRC